MWNFIFVCFFHRLKIAVDNLNYLTITTCIDALKPNICYYHLTLHQTSFLFSIFLLGLELWFSLFEHPCLLSVLQEKKHCDVWLWPWNRCPQASRASPWMMRRTYIYWVGMLSIQIGITNSTFIHIKCYSCICFFNLHSQIIKPRFLKSYSNFPNAISLL